jgi:hypothetical protein
MRQTWHKMVCASSLALSLAISTHGVTTAAVAAPAGPAPRTTAPLAWNQLANAAYPSDWARGKVARLINGVYHERYQPGAATALVVRLSRHYATGDLNGDGSPDAAVILVSDPGGSGTFSTLASVLNEGGKAVPTDAQDLGDRVRITGLSIASAKITLTMHLSGPKAPYCCPDTMARRIYAVRRGHLIVLKQTDTPLKPSAR